MRDGLNAFDAGGSSFGRRGQTVDGKIGHRCPSAWCPPQDSAALWRRRFGQGVSPWRLHVVKNMKLLTLFLLALPAFCVTCPVGVTHIQDTLIQSDGVTPKYGSISIPGSPSVQIAVITPVQAAANVPNVDFCLQGGIAQRYAVKYLLTTSTGRALNSYSEVWFVPITTTVLKIKPLWGGSSAPQYLVSPQQINPAGLAAGQTWVWDGSAWFAATNAAGGSGMADPGTNGVMLRTGLNTSTVVPGTATDCVRVNGTSGACGSGGSSDHAALTHLDYASAGHTGFVAATDSRLSDARTPLSHVHLIADITGFTAAVRAVHSATVPIVYDPATGIISCPTCGTSTGVPSVFGRTGNVVAQSADYTTAQVTESGNLYYTSARAVAAMAGLYQAPITGAPGSWPTTFAPSAHTHDVADIVSGAFAIARIPTGTTGSTVALGNHLHTGVYEPANVNIQSHISNTANPHSVTKAQVGLGNADNTSDAAKPISTLMQAALDLKVPLASANQPNGYLRLDGSGNAVVGTRVLGQAADSYVDPLLATKQAALTLTTTGTSGAATLAGGALNIPQYAGGGMTYPGAGVPNSTGAGWGTSYAVGVGAGDLILGNDARLSDARTPLSHVHLIADITGLQTALNGKQALISGAPGTWPSTFAPINSGDWAGTWQTRAPSYFQVAIPGAPGTWPTFATSATTDATNAANIATGTLNHARLPSLLSGDIPANAANTSGNAATATALAALPTACTAGNYALGVLANGNATGCTAASGGGGTVTSSGPPVIHQIPVWTTATDATGIPVGTTNEPLVGVTGGDPKFSNLILTNPATMATLTIADAKSLTVNKTLTLTGTDGTTMTFPATNATIARTDAANTFTGVSVFSNGVQATAYYNCSLAGNCTFGGANFPASSLYLGNAATNNIKLTGTATSAKVATLPDVTGTVAVAPTSTTATQALFATATAGAPAYRAIAATDLPALPYQPTLTLPATITALFTGCSGIQYLGADGACHSGDTGTAPYLCAVSGVSSIACTHNLGTSQPWVACYDGTGNLLGSTGATTSVTSVVATSASVATLTFSASTTATCLISTGSMGPIGGSGDVLGPATNTAGYLATWNGANSKTLANGIDPATVTRTIFPNTIQTLGTVSIAANSCATDITITATGTLTTDIPSWGPVGLWSGITGYGTASTDGLMPYVTVSAANTITVRNCNLTAAPIIPGAASINVAVRR